MGDIDRLRAGIVERFMTAPERRKIEFLAPGMEEHRQQVMQAITPFHPAYLRMRECGSRDAWSNLKYCQMPLCPRCFLRRRTVETAIALQKTFVAAENNQLAFLTLLLPVTANISEVQKIIARTKTRLDNIVRRRRRSDPRWNSFQLTGWWEMDCAKDKDFEQFGRNRKLALEPLDWPAWGVGRTTWMPHFHAVVDLGGLDIDEVKSALRGTAFSAPYQVDLQPFFADRAKAANVKAVIRYALKFRIERDYKGGTEERRWWSRKDIKTYADWLSRRRGGFQALRFSIGAQGLAAVEEAEVLCEPVVVGMKNSYMIRTGSSFAPNGRARQHGGALTDLSLEGRAADPANLAHLTAFLFIPQGRRRERWPPDRMTDAPKALVRHGRRPGGIRRRTANGSPDRPHHQGHQEHARRDGRYLRPRRRELL